MPVIAAPRLRAIGEALLLAAGAPAGEAATVMRHCVDANLAGHDSHDTCAVQRERDGIAVEDATWAKLVTLARGYGLAQELGLG